MMFLKELIGKPPLQGEVLPKDYPKGPRKMPLTVERPEAPIKPTKPKDPKDP